jgi:dCTP deaminase
MILTNSEIKCAVRSGLIIIDPFDEEMLNPNSYNYHLSYVLKILDDCVLEPLKEPSYQEIPIPDEGIILQPGKVYLGTTVEMIGSKNYVPTLIGRSSLGRLGIFLQISADLGNLGAVHRWTLEIVACQPIHIYPNMVAGQVSFWAPMGEKLLYSGYFGQFSAPTESVWWLLGVHKEENRDLDRTRDCAAGT